VKFFVPLSAVALMSVCASAFAYDAQVSNVPVGLIRVYGNSGLHAFSRSDGAAFPGCTNDVTTMWADSSYVTLDGRKSLLALLLSAKTTGSLIRVYYTTADGYCRFQIIDIL
jgi:hypothetical protein